MPTVTRRQQAHSSPENVQTSTLEDSHMEDSSIDRYEAMNEAMNDAMRQAAEQVEPLEDDVHGKNGTELQNGAALIQVADDFETDQALLPRGLKEISSLASWTVSTAKPGNGVAALRSPDMNQFWQSDGPQPHYLNIHFFKLGQIVLLRIFLDFESDESYTPTKIQFLAGMGAHDLQEFAEMEFEQPTGWIDVDFSQVGWVGEEAMEEQEIDWSKRPVLRAMLVQVKIVENHQNGKDTHLRGIQVFARDESQQQVKERAEAPSSSFSSSFPIRSGLGRTQHTRLTNNIKLASWMQEPDLR